MEEFLISRILVRSKKLVCSELFVNYAILVSAIVIVTFNSNYAFAVSSSDYQIDANTQFLNFTVPELKFGLEIPTNWHWNYSDGGQGMFIVTPDYPYDIFKLPMQERKQVADMIFFGPKITVSAGVPLFPDMTSNEVCSGIVNKFKELGVTIFHTGEKILPNLREPTCTVQYVQSEGEDKSHHGLHIAIMHQGRLYMLTYSAATVEYFGMYMPVMDHVIESFKLY